MEKLYYRRPYVKSFGAVVTDCRQGKNGRFQVTLDRTGFYPEGGGQPGDTGSLGSVKVLDVHEKAGEIIHETDGPLEAGTAVTGTIDWERRFGYMQNHSGEHIFSGLVHKKYGFDNVGFHMGSEEVTVDFNGVITAEELEAVENEVNRKIAENLPVMELYPTAGELDAMEYRSKKELTGQVRIIEIPDGDVCACCGTHVMTTGEIGIFKITGMIHYKGGIRVSMLCGMDALKDYQKKQKTVTELSVLLSAKPEKVTETVEKLKIESGMKDGKINQLYQELFAARMEQFERSQKPLAVFEEGLAPIQLRQYCTMLYEGGRGSVVLVCSGTEGSYQYAAGSSSSDMRELSKYLNKELNGKGGGSSLMAQGTFQAAKQEILETFTERVKE